MTNPESWERIFERVGKVPGSTKQQPAKKTVQALQDEAVRQHENTLWDVAISMGQTQTEDADPYTAINDAWNLGGQATADLKREQDSIAAGLAQLQADVKANNNSGRSFVVAVSDYGTTVPSVFDVVLNTGAGGIYSDGNTLQFSNDTGREILSYNVEPLVTDYPEVSLLVPKQSVDYIGSYGDRNIFFIARADETFDNFVVGRLNGNKLRVGAVTGSGLDSPTWFNSGNGSGPTEVTITPGTYMTLRCGTLAGAYFFEFLVNNQVRATFVDTGEVSAVGDDYRWTAFGLQHNALDFINRSATISHFVANDNAPAPVVGTFGHMYRTSTTQIAVTAGEHELPSGFFEFRGEVSEDIIADEADGTFTVSKSGPYTVTIASRTGTSWVNHFIWVLFINGLGFRNFPMPDVMWGSNALGGTIKPDWVGATMTVHLYEGDVVSFGYNVDGTAGNILRGEATQKMTYCSISGASPSVAA